MKKIKEKRSDKVQREQFPGYPPYPDSEDITLKNKRIPVDNEGVPVINNEEGLLDDTQVQQTDDSDLTDDDLQALGPADLSMDMGEDEDLLKQRAEPVDFAGSDLDIPGSELDNESEKLGSEDEENNSYSIGGDNGDRLEERKD
jgi:hypothetical protein